MAKIYAESKPITITQKAAATDALSPEFGFAGMANISYNVYVTNVTGSPSSFSLTVTEVDLSVDGTTYSAAGVKTTGYIPGAAITTANAEKVVIKQDVAGYAAGKFKYTLSFSGGTSPKADIVFHVNALATT